MNHNDCAHGKISIDEKSARREYFKPRLPDGTAPISCAIACLTCGFTGRVVFDEPSESASYIQDGNESTWTRRDHVVGNQDEGR